LIVHVRPCLGQTFPDGRAVVRFTNGDVKTTHGATGVVVYYYALARTTQTSYPDGLQVYEFPNGQVRGGGDPGPRRLPVL
jgi:hypothetical protein